MLRCAQRRFQVKLENELSSKLQHARIIGTRDLPEVPVGESQVEPVELCVVEGVVGLYPELQPRAFTLG